MSRSALTVDSLAAFESALREGLTFKDASERIGVRPTTAHGWRSRGRAAPDSLFGTFARMVNQVRADAAVNPPKRQPAVEDELLRLMEDAARSGSVRAMTWLLERQWPERWSLRGWVPAPAAPKPSEPKEAGDGGTEDRFAVLDELAPRREDRTR